MYLCVVHRDTDMTAVSLGKSAGYGARLFAFLLGTTLLGGASLALGGALAVPELDALMGTGQADPAIVAAGAMLAFLGLLVLATGYLGAAYKLIADAVATGSRLAAQTEATAGDAAAETVSGADSTRPVEEPSPAAADEPQRAPGLDPESDSSTTEPAEAAGGADETADEWGQPGEAGEAGASAEYDEYGSRQTEGPPEPTPEEIAFGTSSEEPSPNADAPDDESGPPDEPVEETDTGSVTPAARNASSDPLADLTDNE